VDKKHTHHKSIAHFDLGLENIAFPLSKMLEYRGVQNAGLIFVKCLNRHVDTL
jgi:hypothetical protein